MLGRQDPGTQISSHFLETRCEAINTNDDRFDMKYKFCSDSS